jgi:hypothetical protein
MARLFRWGVALFVVGVALAAAPLTLHSHSTTEEVLFEIVGAGLAQIGFVLAAISALLRVEGRRAARWSVPQ